MRPAPSDAAAAGFAAAAAAGVAATIAVLHAVKPELDPSWRFVSEYATGRHAWIMQLAFLVWAAGAAALAVALRRAVASRAGRVGVIVLMVVAAALAAAGLFPQDPVTARPDEASVSGTVHAVASMIGIPGLPIAAVLTTSSLWRTSPGWRPHWALVMATAHATWISLALMVAYLAWAVPRAGGFGPDVWAGAMNRLVVATYLGWQFAVAWRLAVDARRPLTPSRSAAADARRP